MDISDATIEKYIPLRKIFIFIIMGALITGFVVRYSDIKTRLYIVTETFFWNNTMDRGMENTTKYVSVCYDTFNSRRAGNMIFVLSALFYVFKFTGRVPIMPEVFPHGWIDHIFANDIPRFPNKFIYNPRDSIVIHESKPGLTFDDQFKNMINNKSIEDVKIMLICGYFQSYRYVKEVEKELRAFLKFKNSTQKSVDAFIAKEAGASNNISLIGLHVRRTDFTFGKSITSGLSVVDEGYINESVSYIVGLFGPSSPLVAFMCSDDIGWVQNAVKTLKFANVFPNLKVIYSVGHDSAFDLCLLSRCNASIISTGTFSWWSAWLANSSAVYYSLYPRPKSSFSFNFNPKEYYPPNWKGLPEIKVL